MTLFLSKSEDYRVSLEVDAGGVRGVCGQQEQSGFRLVVYPERHEVGQDEEEALDAVEDHVNDDAGQQSSRRRADVGDGEAEHRDRRDDAEVVDVLRDVDDGEK